MLTYAAPSIPNPYEDAAVSQALVYIHADDRETKQLQKVKNNQKQSETIKNNQKQSETIRNNQKQSETNKTQAYKIYHAKHPKYTIPSSKLPKYTIPSLQNIPFKEYVRDMHSIAAPFKLRFYVKRKMVYLAKATTLGESGVEADSTIGISYTDTPEKQAIRNNQLCSTSELKAS